jgi:hypothetical protein
VGEFRKLFGPRQFVQDGAQSDKPVEIGCGREHRFLRAQARHPAEDVGFTAQLVQALHLAVMGTERDQLYKKPGYTM